MPKSAKLALVEATDSEKWHAEIALRKKKLAAGLLTTGLTLNERAFLAVCQTIFRRDSGCTSPFEQFFSSLVRSVQHNTWPTPDDVEGDLETFRDDFETMDRWARLFVEAYPAARPAAAPDPKPGGGFTKPRKKIAHA